MNEHEKANSGLMGDLKIDKFRQEAKLREIKRGDRICLCCERMFFSDDLKQVKLCERCQFRKE